MLEQFQSTGTELAERAVIGAALADKAAIRWASEHVTADDFSSPWLGAAWETLHGRWKAGEPVDAVTMDGAFRSAVQGYKPGAVFDLRSEEHTSELQSRENLVCRLLLEKKK